MLQAIVNLFSYGKRILILYEKSHYITSYKKSYFFLNIYFYFSFYFTLDVEGVLFAQGIPKELVLLCTGYDVTLRLENVLKVKSNK